MKRLDVSLLQDHLLAPILGLGDPRRDKRIDFIGGIRGLKELERRVDSGEMAVAFTMFPTSIHDMMAVADAGEVMPPKSTGLSPSSLTAWCRTYWTEPCRDGAAPVPRRIRWFRISGPDRGCKP